MINNPNDRQSRQKDLGEKKVEEGREKKKENLREKKK